MKYGKFEAGDSNNQRMKVSDSQAPGDLPEDAAAQAKPARDKRPAKTDPQKNALLYLHDFVYLLAVILVLLLLCFRVVVVSGSSMYDTLLDGDYLLIINNIFYRTPKQGDIIVVSKKAFRDGEPIVKRVIATEGQTVDIDFEAGIVYVDGEALVEDYVYSPTTVSEGVSFPLTVEEGCVFVMGDNRGISLDSRDPEIGLIDCREILGKAIFLFFPGTDSGATQRQFYRIGALP